MNCDLKPCPFCGSKLIEICHHIQYDETQLRETRRFYDVCCGTCGVRTGLFQDIMNAKAVWNRRAGDEL